MQASSSGESNTRKRSSKAISARHQGSEKEYRFEPISESEIKSKVSDPLPKAAAPKTPENSCKAKPARPDGVTPCPRCDSSNTKFCYYNNGNVKQPRYFCKGCLRYWTVGGILRNIPPGAGKRKSKGASGSDSGTFVPPASCHQWEAPAAAQNQHCFPMPGLPLHMANAGLMGSLAAEQMRMAMDPMAAARMPWLGLPPGVGMQSAMPAAMPAGFGTMGLNPMQAAMHAGGMQPGVAAYPPPFGLTSSGAAVAEDGVDRPPNKRQARAPVGDSSEAAPLGHQAGVSPCPSDHPSSTKSGHTVTDQQQHHDLQQHLQQQSTNMLAAQLAAAQAHLQQAAAIEAAAAQWGGTGGLGLDPFAMPPPAVWPLGMAAGFGGMVAPMVPPMPSPMRGGGRFPMGAQFPVGSESSSGASASGSAPSCSLATSLHPATAPDVHTGNARVSPSAAVAAAPQLSASGGGSAVGGATAAAGGGTAEGGPSAECGAQCGLPPECGLPPGASGGLPPSSWPGAPPGCTFAAAGCMMDMAATANMWGCFAASHPQPQLPLQGFGWPPVAMWPTPGTSPLPHNICTAGSGSSSGSGGNMRSDILGAQFSSHHVSGACH